MALTGLGARYARRIHDGTLVYPDDVPEKRLEETRDSYAELYGTPLEVV